MRKEENKIKFSVLLSVYQKEKPENLDIALKSVFDQTLLPNEIILVEDGKLTPELYEIINKYEKNNLLKIVKLEKNVGLGMALNAGLKKCSYNYVARVDTDDECMTTRFEKQIGFLSKNPNVDVVGCNMNEYDEKLVKFISKKRVPETDEEIKKYAKKRNPINHPTVIFKKSKVMEVGSYEDCPYFEDYYLWAKLINNNCVFYNMQESLYKFRAGSSMIQRRGGIKYLKSIKKFEKKLLDLKLIDKKVYYINLLERYIISILPNNMRYKFYKVFLRSNRNKEGK